METFLNNKLIFKTDFSESNVIDSAEKQRSYLIVTESGKHLKVSPTSYFLLESFNKGVPIQQIAEILNVSIEKITESYNNLASKIDELDKADNNRRKGFWFLWEIIPGKAVTSFAKPLSIMFHPISAFLSIPLILTGIILNIQTGVFSTSFSTIQTPTIFWIGYILFLISTIAHEFGHASASVRYGARPSGIGFTLYLIFPALYSDVTTSWKLKSWQRAIVGMGGMYFQLLCAAFYTLFGLVSGNHSFKIATLMIFANCVMNLNPFFKFDGYWILSDLLGVVNLSQQPKNIIRFIFRRLKGEKTDGLPWKKGIALFVTIYSISSIFIIVLFIWKYWSHFWDGIIQYPITFQQFLNQAFVGSVTLSDAHKFFLSTASLSILVYFLYNIAVKPLINLISKKYGFKRKLTETAI